MNRVILTVLLSMVLPVWLSATANNAVAREIPMWQGITKTAAQTQADKRLVREALLLTKGDFKAAAHRAVTLGWQEIGKGNLETALRRFNQAWLLEPSRGDIYWGFAVAIGNRGDDIIQVGKFFRIADKIIGPESRLHSDWGRVLEERGYPKAAIEHFDKAIKLNPNNREPHNGMYRVVKKLRLINKMKKPRKHYIVLTK